MLILAVNTATPALGTALWQNGRLLAEATLAAGQPHAATLLPAVERLLAQAGLGVRSIDGYACAVGPGSYTGIRIGVSVVKVMAYASGKPVAGVSTLQAMAWPWINCARLLACPLLDARGGRVYADAWLNGQQVIAEASWPIGDFLLQVAAQVAGKAGPTGILLIQSPSGGTLAAADMAPEVQDAVAAARCARPELAALQIAPAAFSQPSAAAIAEIAEIRFAAGLGCSAANLAPVYLSPSQAMRLADQQSGRNQDPRAGTGRA